MFVCSLEAFSGSSGSVLGSWCLGFSLLAFSDTQQNSSLQSTSYVSGQELAMHQPSGSAQLIHQMCTDTAMSAWGPGGPVVPGVAVAVFVSPPELPARAAGSGCAVCPLPGCLLERPVRGCSSQGHRLSCILLTGCPLHLGHPELVFG